jgi:hypothetical protein
MPFTIRMPFELSRRWYNMISWQFNLLFLQQVIEDPITLSDVECVAHLSYRLIEVDFKLKHTNCLDLKP